VRGPGELVVGGSFVCTAATDVAQTGGAARLRFTPGAAAGAWNCPAPVASVVVEADRHVDATAFAIASDGELYVAGSVAFYTTADLSGLSAVCLGPDAVVEWHMDIDTGDLGFDVPTTGCVKCEPEPWTATHSVTGEPCLTTGTATASTWIEKGTCTAGPRCFAPP
jgi:hypothetical protein